MMNKKTKTPLLWSGVVFLFAAGIAMISLYFGNVEDTATEDINAVYTHAALTVAAQQQTMQVEILSATPNAILSSPTAPLPVASQPQTPALLPSVPSTAVSIACDVAVYVSDVSIPDGTTIAAGEYFTKTWKVSNLGACTWTETYQLVFIAGDSLGGKATAIGKIVKPGESVDVSVVLTSSAAAGSITGSWRLANDQGQTFGDALTVIINSGVDYTATVGVAETAIPTSTSAAATEIPTETPAPTETLVE